MHHGIQLVLMPLKSFSWIFLKTKAMEKKSMVLYIENREDSMKVLLGECCSLYNSTERKYRQEESSIKIV